MVDDSWVRQIATLIKKYKASDTAVFRNKFNEILSRAILSRTLGKEGADVLSSGRTLLERWCGPKPPAPARACDEWIELWLKGRGAVPTGLMIALAHRLPRPKPRQVNWSGVLFDTPDAKVVAALVARKILRTEDLADSARTRPSDFLRSPALDALLSRKKPCPRSVWSEMQRVSTRPNGLLPLPKAIVLSYHFDRARDADAWFLAFLASENRLRPSCLQALLEAADTLHRFVAFLALPGKQTSGALSGSTHEVVLSDLLAVCEKEIAQRSGLQHGSSLALGMLYLALVAKRLRDPVDRLVASSMDRLVPVLIRESLSTAEALGDQAVRDVLLIGRADQVYQGVHGFLRELPAMGGHEAAGTARAVRLERYLAKKEVIAGLIEVLHEVTDGSDIRDAVEVALYNTGVRDIGSEGETVRFDPHLHDPQTPGILPGEPVTVVNVGRRLGGEREGVTLSKAKVVPQGSRGE